MTSDDVVERIRKLLRLASDSAATEGEAAAALERANALLIRHNLSMDAVSVQTEQARRVTHEQLYKGRSGSWRVTLLNIIARHNLCSCVHARFPGGGSEVVRVIGRPANIAVTREMFEWIAGQLERLADQEWRLVRHTDSVARY